MKTEKRIRVLAVVPGKDPTDHVIVGDVLRGLKEVTGGAVEMLLLKALPRGASIVAYVHEEAAIRGMPPNRRVRTAIPYLQITGEVSNMPLVLGGFVVCALTRGGNERSLTEDEVEHWKLELAVEVRA